MAPAAGDDWGQETGLQGRLTSCVLILRWLNFLIISRVNPSIDKALVANRAGFESCTHKEGKGKDGKGNNIITGSFVLKKKDQRGLTPVSRSTLPQGRD